MNKLHQRILKDIELRMKLAKDKFELNAAVAMSGSMDNRHDVDVALAQWKVLQEVHSYLLEMFQ